MAEGAGDADGQLNQDKDTQGEEDEACNKVQGLVVAFVPVEPGKPLCLLFFGKTVVFCPVGHAGPDIQHEADDRRECARDAAGNSQLKDHACGL